MTSGLTIALGALIVTYLGLAAVLGRRWRIRWPPTETVIRELPTPGHHVALYHLPPERARFHEPVILCHGLGANRFNVDFVTTARGEIALASLAPSRRRVSTSGFSS